MHISLARRSRLALVLLMAMGEFAHMIAEGVPQGRAVVIPGAGHRLAIEKPLEVGRLVVSDR